MSVPFDIQGHRGARGLAPENTLPSFAVALELGVTTLELDTVISADKQVVVSHDPWMSGKICTKPNGRPVSEGEEQDHLIYQMPYEEIACYDCGKRRHADFPQQEPQAAVKPLLSEVFAFAEAYVAEHDRPAVCYNVETKSMPEGDGKLHPTPEEFVALIWEVAEAAGIEDRFTLQSFDVRTLQEARRMDLPIKLALLVAAGFQSPKSLLQKSVDDLGFIPDIYSPDFHIVSKEVVALAHSKGMKVLPWTVNEAGDMLRLRGLDVDGLITDYPDVAMATIG